jgi:thymidylate synthase ThyX
LALENISMLAAKFIEDLRIGGSPLEKSTRYIFFDQKVQGEYLYYREPVLMTSAFRSLYIEACDLLFDTYGQLIPPLTEYFEKLHPKDPAGSKAAYTAAIRAKVLDCLRGLLPASTLTNMGIFGNGRFFEHLLHRANVSNLAEMQELGKRSFQELTKVIPSFVRRGSVTHKTHQAYAQYHEAVETEIRMLAAQYAGLHSEPSEAGVKLISFDSESPSKVAAAALFQVSPFSLGDLNALAKDLPEEEINRILDTISNLRENRRHKSPRALEHANFTFEIVSDFGTYRDLHRHRMLTQERQLLTCDLGYFIPHEIMGTPLEEPYVRAMEQAKAAYDTVAQELPEEAQYIVPMAYNVRWYFHINLRSLQWLCELRSQAAGHPTYRYIAQALAHETIKQFPQFERFFKFVDYEGYELGRLGQEERREAKKGHLA